MITPIELHNRQHKTGRGYKKKEMDLFLEEVFENYEKLYKENVELKDKISRLSDGVQQYKTMETALQKALVLAEKTSKDTIESASQKAAVLEKEARLKADTIVNNALDKSDEIKKQCIMLLKQYNQFKAQYKQIALKQIELLDGDFYEIYSKDLIDAVNEASKEDAKVSPEAENNVLQESALSDTNIKHPDFELKKTENADANHTVKISSDMTEIKDTADIPIDDMEAALNGDTKEFTPIGTGVVDRKNESIHIGNKENSGLKEIEEEDAKAKDSMLKDSRPKDGMPNNSRANDRVPIGSRPKDGVPNIDRANDRMPIGSRPKDGVPNNGRANEMKAEDNDEKLDRSIRKLRSQLADDRKSSGNKSSFEFFDNE